MRAAILGPSYPFRGGIAKHTGLLFRNMQAKGHDVNLYSFRKQFPKFLFPGASQFDHSAIAEKTPSVKVFIPWDPFAWLKTADQIKAMNPELLICIWWTPFNAVGYTRVCRMVRKRSNVRILFLLHNVVPHEGIPGKEILSRIAFSQADGYIAQSHTVEREFLRFYPPGESRWHMVVPHPTYNFQEFARPSREESRKKLGVTEDKALLFFGIIRRYKGLKTLLEAFPSIHRHFGGNIRLIIAGEFYDQPQPYLDLISKAGLADSVTIHNRYIPNELVGDYFAASDVVVLPYISASQSGIAQTAFGFDKPVISTQVGGLPETVSHRRTGLLCPANDPSALAGAVIDFYRLSETIDWSANIRNEKSRFSWQNLVEAVEAFHNQQ